MYSTNRLGIRGAEPPSNRDNILSLLAVGGSTTQCYWLDDQQAWPYLVQQKLTRADHRAWVGNAGMSGQSSRGHFFLLNELLPAIRPRAVLFLVGMNDIKFLARQPERNQGDSRDLYATSRSSLGNSLFRFLMPAMILFDPESFRTDRNLPSKPYHHELPRGLVANDIDSEILSNALHEYQENLRNLSQTVKANSAKPIFMTQPSLYSASSYWEHHAGPGFFMDHQDRRFSGAAFWKYLDLYNQALLQVCHTEAIQCLDLEKEIPKSEDYFYDDQHFNIAGSELVSDTITQFLLNPKQHL